MSKYNFFHRFDDTVVGINLCNQTLFALDAGQTFEDWIRFKAADLAAFGFGIIWF